MIINEFTNIEPYTELELDCYQNLLVSLISYYKYDIRNLGAIWPWQFVMWLPIPVDNYDEIRMSSTECVIPERLKYLYNIEMKVSYLDNAGLRWAATKRNIAQGIPVIVGFDQYYAPYHYPHIYQKQHGDHAVLVIGYDDAGRQVSLVSAIPKYKGTMPYEVFFKGIHGALEPACITLSFGETKSTLNRFEIWAGFIDLVNQIKQSYQEPWKPASNEYSYTPAIKRALEQVARLDDDQIIRILSKFCDGTWGWHIHRKCQWTIRFLLKYRELFVERDLQNIVNYFEENNREWELVFRFLFKVLQSRKRSILDNVINRLKIIEQRETELLDTLIETNYYNMMKTGEVK